MITLQWHFLKGRRFIYTLLLIIWVFPLFSQSAPEKTGTLIITFTDIRNNKGKIALGVYDNASQWSDNPRYEYSWNKSNLRHGKLIVEIENLPYSTYALAVLDDEDCSKSMNYFLGLPKEGWGMSTNPSFLKLKQPGFEEVLFDFDCPVMRMEIKVNYLIGGKKGK